MPELVVVLEHTGLPRIAVLGELHSWRRNMERFAFEVPNSLLKISGLSFMHPKWTAPMVEDVVCQAIEVFGPYRCIFGSNFPVDAPSSTYFDLWTAFNRFVFGYSSAERHAMFVDNAIRCYNIPDPACCNRVVPSGADR
jgi:predicted TIM-barrel fold metal-dependent hydrolase